MLIHSIAPPDLLVEQPPLPSMQMQQIQGGYAQGCRTPEGFQIARLCSTDPFLYLRKDLAPGCYLKLEDPAQ